MEIRRVLPEEYEEAGEVTALAYAEFGPSTSANAEVRDSEDWDSYFVALRDVAKRDAKAGDCSARSPLNSTSA